ncbi:hypothetical protein Tco_0986630 [Tanacetum coccineum]
MVAPTIPVSVDSFERSFRDTIDIDVDVIHPVSVAQVVFPAATIEVLKALRFRVDDAEAENASLCATIRTMEAIEMVTRNHERLACIEIERQLASVQESPHQDREDFKKLKEFVTTSELKVNIVKSRLFGIGVSNIEVKCVASSLGCTHGTLLFMYLGLLVGLKMRSYDGWNEVVNRELNSRLGKLNLYQLGFKKSQRSIYWVKWNSNLLDPSLGGLGVGILHAKNLVLLGKWKWRYLTENNALWRNVISIFMEMIGDSPSSTFGNMDVWCNILRAIEGIEAFVPTFKNSFKLIVGNGLNVSFWKDPWCGDGSRLIDVFPRLFALESHQDCKVNVRWCLVNDDWGGNWEWCLPPRGRALNDLNSLLNVIGDLAFSPNCPDK